MVEKSEKEPETKDVESEPQNEDNVKQTAEKAGEKGEKRKSEEEVRNLVDAELEKEAEAICKDLEETNKHLIKLIYDDIGLEAFKELHEKTLEIEKNGGFMTADKKRRKTKGGVFFQLARDKIGKAKFSDYCKRNYQARKKQKTDKSK